jgi:hypothetical protein
MPSAMTDEKVVGGITRARDELRILDARKAKAEETIARYAVDREEVEARIAYLDTIARNRGLTVPAPGADATTEAPADTENIAATV